MLKVNSNLQALPVVLLVLGCSSGKSDNVAGSAGGSTGSVALGRGGSPATSGGAGYSAPISSNASGGTTTSVSATSIGGTAALVGTTVGGMLSTSATHLGGFGASTLNTMTGGSASFAGTGIYYPGGGAAAGGKNGSAGGTLAGGSGGTLTNGGATLLPRGGTIGTLTNTAGGTTATGGASSFAGGTSGGVAGGVSNAVGGASGTSNAQSYALNGLEGRVTVRWNEPDARVSAMFFDRPMRMDAFAAFPPELHQSVLQSGDCTYTKAVTLACNPPCGADQYCSSGNQCKVSATRISAGSVTLTGPIDNLTLAQTGTGYSAGTISAANLAPTGTLTAKTSGAAFPAFTLRTPGVTTASIGFPTAGGAFTLVDGSDKVVTWTPVDSGIVQLLLTAGYHGSPPVAAIICEVPARNGRLVVPRAMVEAYPPGDSINSHTSTIALIQREQAIVNSMRIELLVIGTSSTIFPSH